MTNTDDNYCVDCTCEARACHCSDSDGQVCSCGVYGCECTECKCKNMYKRP